MELQEAKQLYEREWWMEMPIEESAQRQLHEDLLIMPFGVFHEGLEKLTGCSIWTHQLASKAFIAALRRDYPLSAAESAID